MVFFTCCQAVLGGCSSTALLGRVLFVAFTVFADIIKSAGQRIRSFVFFGRLNSESPLFVSRLRLYNSLMAILSKIRVGVLRGGPSFGHIISLKTGAHVLKNLPEKYSPVDVFIDKSGVWHIQGVATPPQKVFKKVDVFF